MSKRTIFTTVTPLPAYIIRDTVIKTLHSHSEMIKLNPLVIKYKSANAPRNASADEFHCTWYELTDKIHYIPGGIISGNVSYKVCFHDLPRGLQTHVYAPTGLDIKNHWSVGGNMPYEPRETAELGLPNAPREGLYLREDVDMQCNFLASRFVTKTLKRAHAVLVERLVVQADILKERTEAMFAQQLAQLQQNNYIHGSSIDPTESQRTLSTYGISPGLPSHSAIFSTPVSPHDIKDDQQTVSQVSGPVHPALLHSLQRPPQLALRYKDDPSLQRSTFSEIESLKDQLARAKAQVTANAYAAQAHTKAADKHHLARCLSPVELEG
ncbi:hypothetical protein AJ79_09320 [Helicocarpus griseus UAMH5409]|uniref:DUF7053 domain-containing protein n=1 Tax=Helicocarpus griseus UAMH5409 TaxID=1447875 RepID=A0A2B7WCI6_9EURO|nr:hypothetical protein AJ79_09320 [Helicocarpus griseus UAMH5409]